MPPHLLQFPPPSSHTFHTPCPSLPLPHPHSSLVIPFQNCHHLHPPSNFDPPHHLHIPHPQASITATTNNCHNGLVSESSSSHSFNSDPHCSTTDCSPRSVIRYFHSSSSGPSPDAAGRMHGTRNATTAPRAKSHNLAALPSSMIASHHPAPCETNRAGFSQVRNQKALMQSHPYVYPPWSSPIAGHQQNLDASSRSLLASSERRHGRYGMVAQTLSDHIHGEAEAERGSNHDIRVRRSANLAAEVSSSSSSITHDRKGQSLPRYSSGSAAVDKPCVTIEPHEPVECVLANQPASQARLRSGTDSDCGTDAHLHRYKASNGFSNSEINSAHSKLVDDHQPKIHQDRSYTCDLYNAEGSSRASSRHSTSAMFQQARHLKNNCSAHTSINEELTPKSPDAVLASHRHHHHHLLYHHHLSYKGHAQFGSKWEDAERWLRPVNHHHYPTGCRGIMPSLGLLEMSDCMNSESAIQPHYMNPLPANATCTTNYVPAHSNCTLSTYGTHSLHAAFSSTNSHVDYSSSAEEKTDRVANHPYSAIRPSVHVGCFAPQLVGFNPEFPYACLPAPLLSTNKGTVREQISHQWLVNPHQYCDKKQNHSMDHSLVKEAYTSVSERDMVPPSASADQLTDRFASGGSLPCTSYVNASDKDIVGSSRIEGVTMPMVSLREVGTQMSSIDGSGSISRYASKSGSPQKAVSPARHNTPAQMRSLSGSASTSGNQRRMSGSKQLIINWDELLQCHRAKQEMQVLFEGDRIRSFHRTTSNWSSREAEEADLSRSLRYSTPELESLELENQHSRDLSQQWPTQSYSWSKDDDSKLAKLKLKEARIQAWEEKIKSKADAKLKRLEENIAKKRSQTTSKIMESLTAAQRKAEEMRASVYAQQRRSSQKGYQLRPRSLSPLSHCTCFSVSK